MQQPRTNLILCLLALALLPACETERSQGEIYEEDVLPPLDSPGVGDDTRLTAVAQIRPLGGSGISGTVIFVTSGDGIEMSGNIRGLNPGNHGFHVHEGTTCAQAGGHFNPTVMVHGAPSDSMRHVGDLGNLEAEADNMAQVSGTFEAISLDGPNSIVGHALIIHQGEDNLTSQPSGDSGPEVGCGIIEINETNSYFERTSIIAVGRVPVRREHNGQRA